MDYIFGRACTPMSALYQNPKPICSARPADLSRVTGTHARL